MRALPPSEAGLERVRRDGRAGSNQGGGGEICTESIVDTGRRWRPFRRVVVGMAGGEIGSRGRVRG